MAPASRQSYIAPHCARRTRNPTGTDEANGEWQIHVHLKFGRQVIHGLPFLDACQWISNAKDSEMESWQRFLNLIQDEHSWVAALSGNANKAPKQATWDAVDKPLAMAIEHYNDMVFDAVSYEVELPYRPSTPPACGNGDRALSSNCRKQIQRWFAQENARSLQLEQGRRQQEAYWNRQARLASRDAAIQAFQSAAARFNAVHRAWHDYRRSCIDGAELGLTVVEVTIMVGSAIATAGLAGGTVWGAVKAGMAVKFYTGALEAAGKQIAGVEDIDYVKLAKDVVLEGLFAFAGKKLVDGFAKLVAEKWGLSPSLAVKLADFLVGDVGMPLLNSSVDSAIDACTDLEHASLRKIWEAVADDMKNHGAATLFLKTLPSN